MSFPRSTFASPRTAFVSRSRELAAGVVEQRRAWLVFLAAAKAQGHLAEAERWPTDDEARSFKALAARLPAFPLGRACAKDVGLAARQVAQALCDCADPFDRVELGVLLLHATAFLERLLTEDGHAAAALSRRVLGEGED